VTTASASWVPVLKTAVGIKMEAETKIELETKTARTKKVPLTVSPMEHQSSARGQQSSQW